MIRSLFFLLPALLAWHCSPDIQPGKVHQLLEPPRQTFVVKTGRDTTLICTGGTVLKFCANTFQTASPTVILEVQELLTQSDILRAGMSTRSTDGRLLESEGMIYLNATEPKGVRINPDCPIEIELPTEALRAETVLFKGKENDGIMEWETLCLGEKSRCWFFNDSELAVLQKGKSLFSEKCAVCHCCDLVSPLTGPALGNVNLYRDAQWLRDYTRQSQRMIRSGDSLAMCLWERWKPVLMNDFQDLSDTDIDAIYAWIASESVRQKVPLNSSAFACAPGEEYQAADASELMATPPDSPQVPINFRTVPKNQNLEKYVFKAYEFGWYNCDVFTDLTTEAELTVRVEEINRYDDVLVSLLYNRRKVNLPFHQYRVGEPDTYFAFDEDSRRVLAFEPARLVAVAVRGSKWYLAEQPIEIKGKNDVTLQLSRLSKKEVDAVLEKQDAPPVKRALTEGDSVLRCPCEVALQSEMQIRRSSMN